MNIKSGGAWRESSGTAAQLLEKKWALGKAEPLPQGGRQSRKGKTPLGAVPSGSYVIRVGYALAVASGCLCGLRHLGGSRGVWLVPRGGSSRP
jgi:hypothetical protein